MHQSCIERHFLSGEGFWDKSLAALIDQPVTCRIEKEKEKGSGYGRNFNLISLPARTEKKCG